MSGQLKTVDELPVADIAQTEGLFPYYYQGTLYSIPGALVYGSQGAPGVRQVDLVSTSNVSLSGDAPFDGVTPVAGVTKRLLTAQTVAAENGEWIQQTGAWTRPPDWDADADVVPGQTWQVASGTIGAGTTWRLRSGITIDGSKVFDRIDNVEVIGVDLTKAPYFVSSVGDSTAKINQAIDDWTATGARLLFPASCIASSPILLKRNIIFDRLGAEGTIAQNFAGGPLIHTAGYGGFPTSTTALAAAEDLSFALATIESPNKNWLDLTQGGMWISAAQFSFELELAVTSAASTHVVSCQGRLAAGTTLTKCFRIGVNATGSVAAILRVGGVEYTLTTATGTVLLDGTTKYHVALDYDGSTIRLWVTAMGALSATPGATPATQAGYASVAATGTVEQYPYEATHLGRSFTNVFPEGSETEAGITGRVGSMRLGKVGRRTAQFTAPSNVLTIDAGAQAGCFHLSPRTSAKFSDGELWRCTIGDGTSTGTSYAVAKSDSALTTCPNAGVNNLALACSTASFGMGTGINAWQAIGFRSDGVTVTSCFEGILIANNSYLSRIGNFKITGHARSRRLLNIGGACGITTVYGKNQIEGAGPNCFLINIKYSGVSWEGQTYLTATTAYCALFMTEPATCNMAGIGMSDENTNEDFGLAACYLAGATGKHIVDLNSGFEMFHTDSQPVIINNSSGSNTQFILRGRIKQNKPTGYAVQFEGTGDGVDVEANVIDAGGAVTNRPGRLLRKGPLAQILQTSLSTSVATRPLFSVAPLSQDARVMPTANVASLTGTSTQDGVLLSNGDVVFLGSAQTGGAERGPWVVGTPWTRPTWFDTSGEVARGTRIRILQGSTNANKEFVLDTKPPYVLGTTVLSWVQFDPPIPVAGLYNVDVVLQCTTLDAGAGSVKVTIGGTDAAGAYTADSPTLAMTALGRIADTSFKVDADGLAHLTWATTVTGAPGAARYRVRITVNKIPEGLG